jgi:hypothetical protein
MQEKLTLQEQVLRKLKKFYLQGAYIYNKENHIKVHVFQLMDKDLEFLKEIEGMYSTILIKRSGAGLIIILNFNHDNTKLNATHA